jgi:CRISPR/Cas system CSM-associated protein Csm2 small subunit
MMPHPNDRPNRPSGGGGGPHNRQLGGRFNHDSQLPACDYCFGPPDAPPHPSGACYACRQKAADGEKLLNSPDYPDYFDAKGNLCASYIDVYPNQIILAFAILARRPLSKRQVRAFFDHVKRVEAAAKQRRETAPVMGKLAQVIPAAQARRTRNLIPTLFYTFLEKNVNRITSQVDPAAQWNRLEAFARHFESVVAFAEGRLSDKEERN